MSEIRRSAKNPILAPNPNKAWESEATFNCCPIVVADRVHLLYRAVCPSQMVGDKKIPLSTIGHALGTDGIRFGYRRQLIKPEYDWEQFGCEDPRVTKVGNRYFIFYTAISTFPFNSEGIRVGLAITKDFQEIEAKHPVTTFNSKAMTLFPGRVGGKLAALLSVNTDKPPAKIGLAFFDHEEQIWAPEYWEGWYTFLDRHVLDLERSSSDHVEVGASPLKTPNGWLLIYSHIQNYFHPPATYGIEAVLLDLNDPTKILARTEEPILLPEYWYEKYGVVPNVIFPSGALIMGKSLHIYYGAADTTCAVATIGMNDFMKTLSRMPPRIQLERFDGNPIIEPRTDHPWEAKAVFNPGAIRENGKVHIVYRAMSPDNTSVLGYASSKDGFTIDERLDEPIYLPRADFEQKLVPGGNSGCEDPRLTVLEDTVYMCYTGFDGRHDPRVALTSISLTDFLAKQWNWSKPILISPPGTMDKDAAFFPRKFEGKFAILHRLGKGIWLDMVENLGFKDDNWLMGNVIMSPNQEPAGTEKIGIAGPPIATEAGWLLIYHVVGKKETVYYYSKAALLDNENPSRVIARGKIPIIEPQMRYEKEGVVPNVVFPCGAVVINDKLFVYYGGADTVIGVATIGLPELLGSLLTASHDSFP